jgi:NADH:ubiquinone oxidoreductase subunit H
MKIITITFLILLFIAILVTVAYYTGAERKIMGAVHRRRGPNVTGI